MSIDRRPFSYDRETGITTTYLYDTDTGVVTFEKSQDAEPLLDLNKEQLIVSPDNWKGELHKVASLPLHIWQDLKTRGIIDDPKRLRAWLNDSDNRFFRTRAGRI